MPLSRTSPFVVCFCSKCAAASKEVSRSRFARLAVLRLWTVKMSSLSRLFDLGGRVAGADLEVLIRELSWEVKERVVEEEISLPPESLPARWL